jgi:hypothetical protein
VKFTAGEPSFEPSFSALWRKKRGAKASASRHAKMQTAIRLLMDNSFADDDVSNAPIIVGEEACSY